MTTEHKPDEILPDDLIPLGQAARLVPGSSARGGVSPKTVYRWIADGRLRSWRVVGRTVISRREILGLIRRTAAGPKRPHKATMAAAARRWEGEVLKRFGLEGY